MDPLGSSFVFARKTTITSDQRPTGYSVVPQTHSQYITMRTVDENFIA